MISFFKNVWSKNLAGKLTLIFGGLILVVAPALVIYAVVTHEGDEGFLKTDDGKPYQWERSAFPIGCWYDSSVQESHLRAYNGARNTINSSVGKPLLGPCVAWQHPTAPMPTKPVADYILLRVGKPPEKDGVTVEDPFKAHPGGVTQPFLKKDNSGHIFGMMVWIDPAFEKGLNPRVWLHESGHTLGLAHDRLQSSIMYSSIAARPGALSSPDIKLLKTAYVQ